MERLDQSFSTGMLVIITDAWTQPQLIKYDIPSRVSVLKKKKKTQEILIYSQHWEPMDQIIKQVEGA